MTIVDVSRRRLAEAPLPDDFERKDKPPEIPDLRRSAHDDDEWMEEAANCLGSGDLFFSKRAADEEAAQDLCRSCPVRAECLDYATRIRPMAGMWAGRLAGSINRARREGAKASV